MPTGPDLSPIALDALNSVVVVEHPLGSGSGFVVGKNIVCTNAHVVEHAYPEEIKVQTGTENNPPRKVSRILHVDRGRDLCLLEVETGLPSLKVRSDYAMRPGEQVTLMGNPSVRGGILLRNASNRGRLTALTRIEGYDYYQIDASVNPGWSGGPVIDAQGNVIAIVAMKAKDEAVAELRSAMQRMDESYRARSKGLSSTGITFGIPGSALARALRAPKLHDEERLAALNDRFTAQTILDRMDFLANLALLRMQVNVPLQVRIEARNLAQGGVPPATRLSRLAGSKAEYVPLMPEEIAQRLHLALASREVREMESQFRQRVDQRLDAVVERPNLSDEVKRDLKALARKIKEASQFAERPATGYAAFSVKVNGFTRDLRALLKRVEDGVEEKEP